MKNASVASFKTNKVDIYKLWLRFTEPLHKLTTQESDLLALLLYKRSLLKKDISNEVYLNKILFGADMKVEVEKEIGIPKIRIHNLFTNFRKKGIIKDNMLTPRYIPNISDDAKSFNLIFNFELEDAEGQETT